ncbi:MAG TPA: imidazole glycerol phosphate synthase subunit HisH [Actinomycetota bacterium]|nr:imidazole glycerol phosphate synthase subunit HisH [Actinomycetota bacterium]
MSPARPTVAVLDYGLGNLRSVARALEHAGARAVVTGDPGEAGRANALVLPGVGAFDACMATVRATGLEDAVRDAVAREVPVFGVCLGMQVLFEGSEEGREPGLALLPGRVRRLPDSVKVPHMGWNEVRWTADHPLVRDVPSGTRFYFVHSYAPQPDPAVTVGETTYGVTFAAVVAQGAVVATQFHPEKSGAAGLALYGAFVKGLP